MTVASELAFIQLPCNGVTTQFSFNNKIFSAADLVATLIDTLGNLYAFTPSGFNTFTNAATGLSYTVNNVDVDTGCFLIFTGAPTNGWSLDLRTSIAELQTTSIKNQGSFLPELHEEFFDKAVRLIQDLERVTYTFGIHGPDIENVPWPALPIASARKGNALMFDAITGFPALGVPNTQTITTGLLAPFLNLQRSPAEITAGVTPTNLGYAPLNVLRYGAIGNGVADDTTAIQAAISVAKVAGGVVYLPPGNYKSSATLAVGDSSNVYIVGAGLALTSISPTTAVTTAVSFGVASALNQGISNLSILCGGATSCVGLAVNNVNGFEATDFLIQQASTGLQIVGGVVHFYSNFQINRNIGTGISINGGNDQFFENGVISSVGFTQPTVAGINIFGNNGGVWMSGVDSISQGVGLLINPASGQSVQWLFAINCAFDTCGNNGINISPSGTGSVYGAAFTGCWTASNTNAGFLIGASTGTVNGVQVVNHRSFNNGLGGYVLSATGTVTNVSFDACVASGNSATTPNTSAGFEIGVGVSGWSIRNCRSGQAENFPVTHLRGILVNTGSSNNYQILNNDVRGNSGAGIVDNGTGATKIVANNLGYNPIGSSAITVTASPFSFANNTGSPIAVMVVGGTVSTITVETQSTGVTTGQFIVPQGASIVVTYTVAPTMVTFGL